MLISIIERNQSMTEIQKIKMIKYSSIEDTTKKLHYISIAYGGIDYSRTGLSSHLQPQLRTIDLKLKLTFAWINSYVVTILRFLFK